MLAISWPEMVHNNNKWAEARKPPGHKMRSENKPPWNKSIKTDSRENTRIPTPKYVKPKRKVFDHWASPIDLQVNVWFNVVDFFTFDVNCFYIVSYLLDGIRCSLKIFSVKRISKFRLDCLGTFPEN